MKKNRSYSEATHLYGRISTASAILMFLMVPIAISVRYAAWPPFRDVLKGLLGVVPVFWTVGVIEVLTYAPMLGTGGTYLAFVTGSLSSLKVPCVLNALKGAGVEPGTDEAEALSTIAVATSSLVTTLVIALGVFGIRFLQPVLENPVLKPAFDNIMPALMGSGRCACRTSGRMDSPEKGSDSVRILKGGLHCDLGDSSCSSRRMDSGALHSCSPPETCSSP